MSEIPFAPEGEDIPSIREPKIRRLVRPYSRSERARAIAGNVLFVGLNAADLITTHIGLQKPGVEEGNPLMHGLLEQSGFEGVIAYKMITVAAFLAGIAFIRSKGARRAAMATQVLCNALVALVVTSNVIQSQMMK